jgi:hypothetical protein
MPEGPPNVQGRNVLGCVKGSLASLASGAVDTHRCARCAGVRWRWADGCLRAGSGLQMAPLIKGSLDPWSPVKPVELVPVWQHRQLLFANEPNRAFGK